MEALIYIAAVFMLLAGLAGTVLPIIPGAPLLFGAAFLAAWSDGFHRVGVFPLIVIGILALFSMAADTVMTAYGAKRSGATAAAAAGALIGTIIGAFFALPGLIVGPFAGAFAGEILAGRKWKEAGKAGAGAWLGLLFGVILKTALAFVMIGVFATAWLL